MKAMPNIVRRLRRRRTRTGRSLLPTLPPAVATTVYEAWLVGKTSSECSTSLELDESRVKLWYLAFEQDSRKGKR